MTTYIALLQAVNVGGTGKLPMADLKALCEGLGLAEVETYIASGNVVFSSRSKAVRVQADLEAALAGYCGKPINVLVRTAAEMADVIAGNPFADARPDQVVAIFLNHPPSADAEAAAKGRIDEAIALGLREIYIHYPQGMGRSKLRIPAASTGTARNMNTVAKLAQMASMRRP